MSSDIDTKPIRQAATSQPWPWTVHTNPVIAAILVYTIGVVTYTAARFFDLSYVHGAIFALPLAAGCIVKALDRHVHPSAIGYTVTMSVLGAAWITYATGADTLHITGAITCLGTGALVIPWYIHLMAWRKRHPEGTVAEVLAAPETLPDSGDAAPDDAATPSQVTAALAELGARGLTYLQTVPAEHGGAYRHDYRSSARGTLPRELAGFCERLDIALGSPYRGAVRVEADRTDVSVAHVFVAHVDFLAQTHLYPEVTTPMSITEPKRIVVYDDGAPGFVNTWQASAKIIGKRNSGKSSAAHVMVSELTRCYDELVILIDPKGAPLLGPWLRPYALGKTGKPLLYAVARTVEEMRAVTAALIEIGDMRTATLVESDKIHPSPAQPHFTLIIDEAHRVIGASGDKVVRENVRIIISQQRAGAEDAILLSQRSTNSHLNSRDIRTQIDWTALHNVEDNAEVVAAIGRVQREVDPMRFTAPGQILLKTSGTTSRVAPARWLRLPEERIPALAERHTEWRPDPEPAAAAIFAKYGVTTWWDTPGHTGYNVLQQLRGLQRPPVGDLDDVPAAEDDDRPTDATERLLTDIVTVMEAADLDRAPSAVIAAALADRFADDYRDMNNYGLAVRLKGLVKARQLGAGADWDGNPRGYTLGSVRESLAQLDSTQQTALRAA